MKILIADDETQVRQVIQAILGGYGHEVLAAPDGKSAIEIAISERPDMIVLDLLMPGKSGFEVLDELKSNPATKSIPVIVVTALTGAQEEQRATKAGAVDYITKPWAPGELEDRIRMAVPDQWDVKPTGMVKGSSTAAPVSIPQRASAMPDPISTGSDQIDKALLGGIPLGSLTLIEGPSGAGKSVLCDHIAFGAMLADQGVAYYTSGIAPDGLIPRMGALGLDVRSFAAEGQLTVRPLENLGGPSGGASGQLGLLRKQIEELPWDTNVVIIDSLSSLAVLAGSAGTLNFLMDCKNTCRMGKAIVISLHTSAFDPELRNRLDALFATHLILGTEGFTHGIQMKTMNVIEIEKVKDTFLQQKTLIYFEVDPELGRSMNMSIKVLPIHKIKT